MSAPAVGDAVKALHRVNGRVLPGAIFIPDSDEQRVELFALEAIAELTSAERLVFAQTELFTLSELSSSLEMEQFA